MNLGILPRILIYNGGFYMIDGTVGRIGRNENTLSHASHHLFRAKTKEDAEKKVEQYRSKGFNCKYFKRIINKVQGLEDHLVVFTPNTFDRDEIPKAQKKYQEYLNRCQFEGAEPDSFYNFLLNYKVYKDFDFSLIGEADEE